MPQTKLSFSKVLNSKWTAVAPQNSEKHFIVTRIADHRRREVKLECPVTGRDFVLAYSELLNGERFIPGWK